MIALTREGILYEVRFNSLVPKLLMTDAVTFDNVIYVKDKNCLEADLHCHEFQHLKQQKKDGLFKFLIRYLYQRILYGYRGIDYETFAYACQGQPKMVEKFDAVINIPMT